MRRFLMLVAVAVVAAAMYVAASPASHVSKGVSVAKFNALSKKVAKLTKTVKTDGNLLNDLAYAYLHCSLHYGIGVTQRGDLGGGVRLPVHPSGELNSGEHNGARPRPLGHSGICHHPVQLH
jgi:hypothetical protein